MSTTSATPVASTSSSSERPVPAGYTAHTESTTTILLSMPPQPVTSTNAATATTAPVFLNPVQQYNRDLSVVAIRTWSEQRRADKERKWAEGVRKNAEKRKAKMERKRAAEGEVDSENAAKKRKVDDGESAEVEAATDKSNGADEPTGKVPAFTFTCLEALSATGLRAIRYAKEIPLLRYVLANDLSASAVADIRRNIEFNGLAPPGLPVSETTEGSEDNVSEKPARPTLKKSEIEELTLGKVRPNEGDACTVMYTHRTEATRFDCVDLDPYGSAVPFLDAAIGAVADGGLLCVTCTDAGVLAGHNYPEKAFTHYGGVCVTAEYCHEVGLRLMLNAIATTAGRYGRSIEPLVSLSIDFYMRVFVRVHTSPKEVKMLPSKTSLLYYCQSCQAPHWQAMGRVTEKTVGRAGREQVMVNHSAPTGPPVGVGEKCSECGGRFQIGGPMWSAPIHNKEFVAKMLEEVAESGDAFGTSARMQGMLSLAYTELDAPLLFTPARLAGLFHCVAPPLTVVASALLNAGHGVSRSHTSPGSIKTSAPRPFVMDVFREWIKTNPVKMDNVKPGSPAARLLAKEQIPEVDLTLHPGVDDALRSKERLVRYQINPAVNWGPGRAAAKGVKH